MEMTKAEDDSRLIDDSRLVWVIERKPYESSTGKVIFLPSMLIKAERYVWDDSRLKLSNRVEIDGEPKDQTVFSIRAGQVIAIGRRSAFASYEPALTDSLGSEEKSPMVWVADNRSFYHRRPDCLKLPRNKAELVPVDQAIDDGFIPCAMCSPEGAP